MDAAHVVLAPFLGVLWCCQRLFVKAPSGRQRLNVLTALNAISRERFTVEKLTYITAETVCELLRLLAGAHQGIHITVFLDNARYQRCALVQAVAQEFGMELCFLPTYSPHLNLIERLWRFVKKQCLYSKYYPDSISFQQAILTCIQQASTIHKEELNRLLTLNFQTFQDVPVLGEQQTASPKPRQKVLSQAA
jgi:transposase